MRREEKFCADNLLSSSEVISPGSLPWVYIMSWGKQGLCVLLKTIA